MHGNMNEDKLTVEPPINVKIGPKRGIDCATNKTAAKIDTLMITRLKPNSFLFCFVFHLFIIKKISILIR